MLRVKNRPYVCRQCLLQNTRSSRALPIKLSHQSTPGLSRPASTVSTKYWHHEIHRIFPNKCDQDQSFRWKKQPPRHGFSQSSQSKPSRQGGSQPWRSKPSNPRWTTGADAKTKPSQIRERLRQWAIQNEGELAKPAETMPGEDWTGERGGNYITRTQASASPAWESLQGKEQGMASIGDPEMIEPRDHEVGVDSRQPGDLVELR